MIFKKKDHRKALGSKGEDIATKFLKKKGYKILQRNYRCKYGEIDIIAERDNIIAFIEVRTVQTEDFGIPQDFITNAKTDHISKSALNYIKKECLFDRSCRFDLIAITFSPTLSQPKIEHIENAFELSNRYKY